MALDVESLRSMQSLVDRHSNIPATERPIWKALEGHYQELRKLHLRDLFAHDPKRGERLTAEAVGIYLDYSRNRIFDGNRPSNTILAERTPAPLSKLVALYEHSVSTQAAIWQIDAFDQWGVELGKVLAQSIVPELESGTEPELDHDSSTNPLIRRYRKLKETL